MTHYQRENINSQVSGVSHFKQQKSLIFIICLHGCHERVQKSPASGYRSIPLPQAQLRKQPRSARGLRRDIWSVATAPEKFWAALQATWKPGEPREYKPNLQ